MRFNILLDSPCNSISLPIWTLSYTTEYSMEKIVWKSISVHNKINCLPTYTHCLQCLQVGKLETCNDKDIGSFAGSSMAKFNKVNQFVWISSDKFQNWSWLSACSQGYSILSKHSKSKISSILYQMTHLK